MTKVTAANHSATVSADDSPPHSHSVSPHCVYACVYMVCVCVYVCVGMCVYECLCLCRDVCVRVYVCIKVAAICSPLHSNNGCVFTWGCRVYVHVYASVFVCL